MHPLTEFVTARLDEVEAYVGDAIDDVPMPALHFGHDGLHVQPSHVRALVKALREIAEQADGWIAPVDPGIDGEDLLGEIAAIWADHPDYQQAIRPALPPGFVDPSEAVPTYSGEFTLHGQTQAFVDNFLACLGTEREISIWQNMEGLQIVGRLVEAEDLGGGSLRGRVDARVVMRGHEVIFERTPQADTPT